jgi:hypothetical protein
MSTLPFACKDCGATGEAELAKLMGVKMTCEYCGANVSPPRYDVQLEPPEALFKTGVIVILTSLLGISTPAAMEIVNGTRVVSTGVPAEVADRQRATIAKVGGKVVLTPK